MNCLSRLCNIFQALLSYVIHLWVLQEILVVVGHAESKVWQPKLDAQQGTIAVARCHVDHSSRHHLGNTNKGGLAPPLGKPPPVRIAEEMPRAVCDRAASDGERALLSLKHGLPYSGVSMTDYHTNYLGDPQVTQLRK